MSRRRWVEFHNCWVLIDKLGGKTPADTWAGFEGGLPGMQPTPHNLQTWQIIGETLTSYQIQRRVWFWLWQQHGELPKNYPFITKITTEETYFDLFQREPLVKDISDQEEELP